MVRDQFNIRGRAHELIDALSQIAEYMHDLGLEYGVFTTYSWTIFLRQVVHNMRLKLEFSPGVYTLKKRQKISWHDKTSPN